MKFLLRNTFILLIIFSACKPSRHISRKNTPANQPLPNLTAEEIIQKVNGAHFNFDELSGKAELTVRDSKKTFSINIFLRMKRDSVIWINFNALGTIELARMKMTRDSVWVLDRFNKKVYIKSFSSLAEMLSDSLASDSVSISFLNMWINDFGFLQDLLIGNMRVDTSHKYSNNYYSPDSLNDIYYYRVFSTDSSFHYEYGISPSNFRIEKLKITRPNFYRYEVSCNNFADVDNSILPIEEYYSYLKVLSPSDTLGSGVILRKGVFYLLEKEIKISYSKLEVPKEKLNYPFIIPSDYEIIR